MIEENARTSAEPVTDESYSITTEDGKAIIRADGYLGTMWGIYTFSEKFLGVDPCYLFNDLAIVKKSAMEMPETHIVDKWAEYDNVVWQDRLARIRRRPPRLAGRRPYRNGT